jgi:23S rRNA (uracil1939-C5)-methyltransferase
MHTPLLLPSTIEGTIEKMAFGGAGILRTADNFVVFVQGGILGEVVRVQITKRKKHYAEAKVLEVLSPSPFIAKNSFPSCPGCSYQKLEYETQLAIKSSQLEEILFPLKKMGDFQIFPIIASPEIIRYRNKMEFSFGYESMTRQILPDGTKKYQDSGFALGFHPVGNWATVLSVSDALICPQPINNLRQILEDLAKKSGIPPWNPKIHRGFWRGAIFRMSKTTEEILINIIVHESKNDEFWSSILSGLLSSGENISGILQTVHEGKSESLQNPKFRLLYGKETISEDLREYNFVISPFSFFQTNTLAAEKLYSLVKEFADLDGTQSLLDLFCGTGTIGIFLSSGAKKIMGIELCEESINMAKKNAKTNGVKNAEFLVGKVEELLPAIEQQFDTIIIDPPRVGMHPKTLNALLESSAKKIVYISCNPTSFVRDVETLSKGGWNLKKFQAVDMFPHTPHVECVGLLTH